MDAHPPPSAYHASAPRGTRIIVGGTRMVRMFCNARSEYGCAILHGASFNGKPIRCLIVARNDVSSALHRDIVNHEIAHCNGWRHAGDH
jgi:hypothetical protein